MKFINRLDFFPFKQIDYLMTERAWRKEEKYNEEMNRKYGDYSLENDDMKFIWGIKSWDCLSKGDVANLETMNDIDLIYLKDENRYILSIETMYGFDTEEHKMEYLKECLDEFTKFMKENGYDTDKKPFWMDVFSYAWNMNTHFDSIEDCYAMFKMLVNGYCSL